MTDNKTTAGFVPPVVPEGVRPAYVNLCGIQMTQVDVRFFLAEKINRTDPGEMRASVVMAPTTAKAFLHLLSENIKKYEDVNGEIAWQPKKPVAGAAKKAK